MNPLSLLGLFGLALVVGVAVLMLIRNQRVFRYRMAVIERIHEEAQADIAAGRNTWMFKYEALDAISYDEMVYKLWRPLDSFFPPELRP